MKEQLIKLFRQYNNELLFIGKIAIIYLILNSMFTILIGLSVSGGTLGSTFFQKNINIIDGLNSILLNTSEYVLNFFGFETYLQYKTLGIIGNKFIIMEHACLGFQLISGYLALVFAFPASLKRKFGYAVIGILLIQLLNVIRISGLVYLYSFYPDLGIVQMNQHDLFNIFVIFHVGILYFIFITNSKKIGR